MIELRGVSRTYRSPTGAVAAVRDLDLVVPAGSFTTLLGPSGCGKSTVLRLVAGLERPDAGEVVIAGRTVACAATGVDIPAHRRGLGMVFQSYAVWPHLTVAANVAYPLRAVGIPRSERHRRTEEALAMVGLQGAGPRRTTELSGGQQQRVALARALVARPPVLLLDEPLSNLDARLRDQIRSEILDLRRDLGITVLFVTHDRAEALSMSDEVVVLAAGRRLDAGPPADLYARPSDATVARLLGIPNVVDASWDPDPTTGDWSLVTPFSRIPVGVRPPTDAGPGDPCAVVVRPDAVAVQPPTDEARSGATGIRFTGVVVRAEFQGETSELLVDAEGVRLRIRGPEVPLGPGTSVTLLLDPAGCLPVPA